MNKSQPHVLLIAPFLSYRIAPYLKAASELGVKMTVASTGEHSLVSAIAEGVHIDFSDQQQALETLKSFHQHEPLDAVIGSDDAGVELASLLATELGLPANPPGSTQCTRRKDMARKILHEKHISVPTFHLLDLNKALPAQLDELDYPCVLKPVAMSMSRGVIRVNNPEEALTACSRIQVILEESLNKEEKQIILAEEYIDGVEVAYEGVLQHGELISLLLFDKPEPLTGPYFEETYYITPSRLDPVIQQGIFETVSAACQAYGLVTGPVHAECRIDKNKKVWVMEVAARTIGGECARLVELATGESIERLVINNALSELQVIPKLEGAAGVLMLPTTKAGVLRRVEGLMAAKKVKGIKELVLSVREGQRLVPLPEGSSYLGFIYGVADTPEEVEQSLRDAYSKLNIVVAPLFEIEDRRNVVP